MFNCFITLNLLLIAIHTKHFCLNQTAYWWKHTPFRLPRSVERVPIKRLLQIRRLICTRGVWLHCTCLCVCSLSGWWSGRRQQWSAVRSSCWRWRSRRLTEKKTNRLHWVPQSSTTWTHALPWLGEWTLTWTPNPDAFCENTHKLS